MPLLLLLTMSVLQWLVVQLPMVQPEYDATIFLYGNLQIITTIFAYKLIKKYIRINYE